MHYINTVDLLEANVKHGRRTETLEGFLRQSVKHNPIAHELLKHQSSIYNNLKHAWRNETLEAIK
jgi:hypothetical protein